MSNGSTFVSTHCWANNVCQFDLSLSFSFGRIALLVAHSLHNQEEGGGITAKFLSDLFLKRIMAQMAYTHSSLIT